MPSEYTALPRAIVIAAAILGVALFAHGYYVSHPVAPSNPTPHFDKSIVAPTEAFVREKALACLNTPRFYDYNKPPVPPSEMKWRIDSVLYSDDRTQIKLSLAWTIAGKEGGADTYLARDSFGEYDTNQGVRVDNIMVSITIPPENGGYPNHF